MKRIDTTTRALDLFGAGKDGFKDGNLALGQPPTDFNADWPNGIQEELLAVIEAAGIAPTGAVLNQLLLALRSTGVFQTPARFDNTTRPATTEFVKRHGLQASGVTTVATTGALTTSHAGGTVAVTAAGATTQTLPAANTMQVGSRIELINIGAGRVTVARAGADTIKMNSAAGLTSLGLGNGDTLVVMSNGVDTWYVVGGSAQLAAAYVFSGSMGDSGHQPLPGGFLMQWASLAVGGTGDATWTFPIAFPTQVRKVFGITGNSAAFFSAPTGPAGTTSAIVSLRNASAAPVSGSVAALAIGH